jgi:hypothetical protein
MSDLRVSQDVARNLFFLADSLPVSANCSRTDDQGSPPRKTPRRWRTLEVWSMNFGGFQLPCSRVTGHLESKL